LDAKSLENASRNIDDTWMDSSNPLQSDKPMKPLGESFGFGTLITVFLPGVALAIGILVVLQSDPGWKAQQDSVLNVFSQMKEWQQTFSALAIISLLGSLIGTTNGLLESLIYDRVTPHRMGISRADFNAHWQEYLYRLSKENNSYVSRVVTWFLFESRMAVAILLVFVFYMVEGFDREMSTAILLLVAVGALGYLGYHHHRELAEYRRHWHDQWRTLREAERAVAENTPRPANP
jgi:hypothetical protein